jgi:hypothetical protein
MTHSIITHLDRRGEDIGAIYDLCDWPPEFLRDSASWMEAAKLEGLLAALDREFGSATTPDGSSEVSLCEAAGHQSKDLRAWGVLDSVLRMVQSSKDLFAQPERFLSYFVSPAPPLGDLRRGVDSIDFVLPISTEQYPFVTSYLRAALESLPTYINKPMATVVWQDSHVVVQWSEKQASLLSGEEAGELSLHPELMRNILNDLEASQKELQAAKQKIALQEVELEIHRQSLRASLAPAVSSTEMGHEQRSALEQVLHDVHRLGDYFARGQQLITLLIGQGRQTPQVQEAMRRVDWHDVVERYPVVVKQTVGCLRSQLAPTTDHAGVLNDLASVNKAELTSSSRAARLKSRNMSLELPITK